MKLKLISEELGSSSVSGIISESHGGEKQYYIQGVFGQAEVRNGNGRVYPLDILTEAVERFQKVIDGGHAYGECDHPLCLTVSMQNASHRITKLWMEGNNMMGRAIIMPNEKGNVLISALKTGGRIPVSTRGAGQLDENNKVKKGFRLVTVDAVANPSAPSAFTNGIYEGKEFLLEGDEIVEERLNDIGLVRSPAFTVLNRWIQG